MSLLIPFPSKGVGDEKRCSCQCDDHGMRCYASMFFEKRMFVDDLDFGILIDDDSVVDGEGG